MTIPKFVRAALVPSLFYVKGTNAVFFLTSIMNRIERPIFNRGWDVRVIAPVKRSSQRAVPAG